jgi:hypothetical protein
MFEICSGHGARAARHLLQWGSKQQCCNIAAFQQDIVDMFQKECNIFMDKGIDLDKVNFVLQRQTVVIEVTVHEWLMHEVRRAARIKHVSSSLTSSHH